VTAELANLAKGPEERHGTANELIILDNKLFANGWGKVIESQEISRMTADKLLNTELGACIGNHKVRKHNNNIALIMLCY